MEFIFFGNQPWLLASAAYLRWEIFVKEQQIHPEDEFDEKDAQKTPAFVVFRDEKMSQPIATIRYQPHPDFPQLIQPDRFCVVQNYRQQGIASRLLTLYEEKAQTEGYLGSRLSAESSAQNFYQKLGYTSLGRPYLEDGISCIQMEKFFH